MVDTVSKEPLKQEDVSLKTEKDYKRGVHPNSQANLKPFEKGISGNPSGRPQKYEGLKRALEPYGNNFSTAWKRMDWTKKEVVLETIWQKAEEGSIPHITILANLGLLDD